jgi:hypothetical protein
MSVALTTSHENGDEVFDAGEVFDAQELTLRSTVSSQFDYSYLAPEKLALVKDRMLQLRAASKSLVELVFNLGKLLSEIKKALGHGKFLPWLAADFPFSESTANNVMKAYRKIESGRFGDLRSLSGLTFTQIYKLGMKELAPPSESGERDTEQQDEAPKERKKHTPELLIRFDGTTAPVPDDIDLSAPIQNDLRKPPEVAADDGATELIGLRAKGSGEGFHPLVVNWSEISEHPKMLAALRELFDRESVQPVEMKAEGRD